MQLYRLSIQKALATMLGPLALSGATVGCSPPGLASVSRGESPRTVVFRDISVFDGEAVVHNQDVIVRGSLVDSVGPTGSSEVPPHALRIDGAGLTLLPGLVDSHAHLFSAGGKTGPPPEPSRLVSTYLYAGVTTLLLTAGFGEAASLEEGALAPHLYTAGPGLTAPGGHPIPLLRSLLPWPISWMAARKVVTAADAGEARRQVEAIARRTRPQFLKIIYDDLPPGAAPHLSAEALKAAIDQAKESGMRPIVHATTPSDTIAAAEAGASLMVHIPQRGTLSEAQVARLVELGTPFVSTVRLVSASWDLAARGPIELERAMYSQELLRPWQEDPSWDLAGFSEEIDERHAEVADITQANFKALDAAGVPIFVGTDSGVHGVFPGAALHRELRLLVRLGMPPLRALRAVTSAPADFLDPDRSFGRIAKGQRADLLVVEGDPTSDIAALAEIREVFLDGVRLNRRAVPPGAPD